MFNCPPTKQIMFPVLPFCKTPKNPIFITALSFFTELCGLFRFLSLGQSFTETKKPRTFLTLSFFSLFLYYSFLFLFSLYFSLFLFLFLFLLSIFYLHSFLFLFSSLIWWRRWRVFLLPWTLHLMFTWIIDPWWGIRVSCKTMKIWTR